MNRQEYLAPEIEVFEVAVEQGFAQSGTPYFTPFGDEQQWS